MAPVMAGARCPVPGQHSGHGADQWPVTFCRAADPPPAATTGSPPRNGHDHCSLAASQAAALAVLSGQARPYHTQSGQPVSTGLGFLAQLYQVARARPPRPPRQEEAKGRTAAFETVQWSYDRSMEDGTRVDRYAVDSRRPRVTANELACALTALRT